MSAFCRSLFCAFCTCPLITGACNYLFCANVGWPLVRLLNFYERLSALLCSYNIHLLWLHPWATQRVYNFWVLARDSYLTSTLPLWNSVQSPIAMVWRFIHSSKLYSFFYGSGWTIRDLYTSPTSCSLPPPSPFFLHPDVFIQWCLDVWFLASIKGYHREALYGTFPVFAVVIAPNVCVECF